MKFKRSTLIAIVWGRADEKVRAKGLDPVDFGFKLENDRRFVKKLVNLLSLGFCQPIWLWKSHKGNEGYLILYTARQTIP